MRCSAPLPKDSASLVLTRMLVTAPYQVPVKEDNEESKKGKVAFILKVHHTLSPGRLRLPLPKTKRRRS